MRSLFFFDVAVKPDELCVGCSASGECERQLVTGMAESPIGPVRLGRSVDFGFKLASAIGEGKVLAGTCNSLLRGIGPLIDLRSHCALRGLVLAPAVPSTRISAATFAAKASHRGALSRFNRLANSLQVAQYFISLGSIRPTRHQFQYAFLIQLQPLVQHSPWAASEPLLGLSSRTPAACSIERVRRI